MALTTITFDIWETIIVDDSDEPKRAALGLRSKPAERRHLMWQALNAEQAIDKSIVDMAYDMHEAAYRQIWYGQQITLEVPARIDMVLAGLGRSLPDAPRQRLVEAFETMEIEVRPDPIDGAAEVIRRLAERYKLGIISDTIYTPGVNLRVLLEGYGVKDCFSGFVFSDEVGRSKPHADTFTEAARQLNCEFADMLHIGDRDAKDVVGPQALGMKAVLFTASRDEGTRETTKADAIAGSYAELEAKINELADI